MEVTTSEIQDAINEPEITKLLKGDSAPFDGALMPFNTLKSFVEFRYNYERLKQDYISHGVIKDDTPAIRTIGSYIIVFGAGMLIASALSSEDNRSGFVIGSAVAMATGITLVVF